MGKEVQNSSSSFEELKVFTDAYYGGSITKENVFEEAYKLLARYGIKLRQDDGHDPRMTVSIPKAGNIIVVGMRYAKKSGRKTEDHFVLKPKTNLYKCKGKELDRLYPEYKGSHIQQS